MLYEYPEEFVVSVIYVKDLEFGFDDSGSKFEFSINGGLLEIPEDKIERWGLFSEKNNTMKSGQCTNTINIKNEDEVIKEQQALGDIEHYNSGNILSSIDDEYANSETD